MHDERATGTADTRMILLRGNSGSGKSTLARALQREHPRRRVALVGQDVLRRDVLNSDDGPDNPAIGLLDLTARYALDRGMHVVLEGILTASRYADLLTGLVGDHCGLTTCVYLDIPFDETVRRHATKPRAHSFGETEMREWYAERDLVPGLDEVVIGPASSLEQSLARIRDACGWAG